MKHGSAIFPIARSFSLKSIRFSSWCRVAPRAFRSAFLAYFLLIRVRPVLLFPKCCTTLNVQLPLGNCYENTMLMLEHPATTESLFSGCATLSNRCRHVEPGFPGCI